jgi:hypothetical protein
MSAERFTTANNWIKIAVGTLFVARNAALFAMRRRSRPDDRLWRILLQKSKIEQLEKSRENRSRGSSPAALLVGVPTETGERFWMERYGPSRRSAQTASAAIRIFVQQPKRLFQQYRRKAVIEV